MRAPFKIANEWANWGGKHCQWLDLNSFGYHDLVVSTASPGRFLHSITGSAIEQRQKRLGMNQALRLSHLAEYSRQNTFLFIDFAWQENEAG